MSQPPTGTSDQGASVEPASTSRLGAWMRELVASILPALVIVLLVNVFVAQATRVEGQSMEPNLHDHQRVIIEKLTYHFRNPERGEIVVLRPPQRQVDPLIKRVVGLPGETIEIHDGHVYVNGVLLQEPYLTQQTWGTLPPTLVPEDHVFVMGDNRGSSNDSRAFGAIAFEDVIGRAWVRYWPVADIGVL
ncbi:MAG: signal peptidase I [Chloroflexi bacterium]|nr:signal peptidase I [Chloroflexota bacterium]